MFFRSAQLSSASLIVNLLAFCFVLFTIETTAQTKKTNTDNTTKSTIDKKGDDRKTDRLTVAKPKEKNTKTDARNSKPLQSSKSELAKQTEQKRIEESKRQAEAKREAEHQAAIRKAEEARKQAALAEQRRREQAAREARERALAFERGLKSETQENIANDDTEGEDLEVRRAAVKALGNRAGTVVVMEPQTGKVLSIVNQEWGIRSSFKPCSTIKLVTGVAGLNEKIIGVDGNIKTRSFPLNLDDALAHSNNSYFQVVGQGIGNERLISYATALGLGEPTGINAENESAGKLPHGNNHPRIYSHGDDFEVTPLQLSVMVSALSNGGKIVVPQIPRTRAEKINFRGFMKREVELPGETLTRTLPGMIAAVNYGTAKLAADYSLNIAGKTGSCIGQGTWLGLFASVAPVVNPRLSVVVITRGSGERGKFASEIAGKIYKSLAHRFNDTKDYVAKVPLELQPKQQATAKTSSQLDSKEGEASVEGDVPKVQTQKKLEDKKPLFEPIIITVGNLPTRPRIVEEKP